MIIIFPHINGPYDGYLRFTELVGVKSLTKEDDFVTKTPSFKAWPVIICQRYNLQARAIRFISKEARDQTFDKLIRNLHSHREHIYLNSDDFTLPSMPDEQAFKLLRQRGTTHDLHFEVSRVVGRLEDSDALRPFKVPNLILDDARRLPALKQKLAIEMFTLTLMVPKAILNIKISRKQYFTYKCTDS